jgi:hypothetical protein
MSAGDGLWLHAVMRDPDPAQLSGLTGVGGRDVRAVPVAGLTAIVCPVDLGEFGEEPLRGNLENIGWVEAVARTHHQVAVELSRFGPVIPARLATIYLSDASVVGLLTRCRTELAAALERIGGRIEWGVKAYTASAPRPPRPAPAPAGNGAGNGAGTGAGADYLRRKRAALSARSDAAVAAADCAERLHTKLAAVAEDARRHPPQSRGLNPRAASMVLNGSYLVESGQGDRFTETVAELADGYGALDVELTGPWLPYSFATVPLPETLPETADG